MFALCSQAICRSDHINHLTLKLGKGSFLPPFLSHCPQKYHSQTIWALKTPRRHYPTHIRHMQGPRHPHAVLPVLYLPSMHSGVSLAFQAGGTTPCMPKHFLRDVLFCFLPCPRYQTLCHREVLFFLREIRNGPCSLEVTVS